MHPGNEVWIIKCRIFSMILDNVYFDAINGADKTLFVYTPK